VEGRAQHFRKREENEYSPPRYAIFEPKFEPTICRLWTGGVAIGHSYGQVVSLLDTVMLTGGVAIGHSYAERWCRYWTQLC